MNTAVFTLSVEHAPLKTFQHGFHLGTDEKLAREIAAEYFHNRRWDARVGSFEPVTVALMRGRKIVDVYDGEWASARG